jgi:glycosyltransferase involved in cell wall biosynthesis
MRILVVTQYFPPDMGAPAGRFHDFAQSWLALGHEVVVLTGLPHFPGGVIHEGYRGRLYLRDDRDGIEVHRCWTLTSRHRFLGRALAYASFLLSACVFLLLGRVRYDCVVATSPPPTIGVAGVVAGWRRRVPWILDIRDIWPEAIVQSNRLRNPLLIRAFEGTAQALYRLSTHVTTVTDGWRERLIELGVPPAKVDVLANGVDIGAFDRESQGELTPAFAALEPGAAWFTYAGILNTPQGIEVILEAAARMRDTAPDLYARSQFVVVGEGPSEAALRALAAERSLERAVFVPRQPRAAVFALLRRSFAVIVPLRPRKDTSTVPSKLYESLASGRPVLYSAGGEGADTLRRAQGGAVCAPGDAGALCDAMVAYLRDPERADADGRRGRAYVAAHFDRRQISESFARLLERAAPGGLPIAERSRS